jgi:hypothetical protein
MAKEIIVRSNNGPDVSRAITSLPSVEAFCDKGQTCSVLAITLMVPTYVLDCPPYKTK